ncbi:MAG: hypothetical protein IM586_17875 [Pseudanabaena sp. M172S2SP2A07QC]|nr:hypothetical protein [Pseudanabaena sp. M172S2SP2A07QC]
MGKSNRHLAAVYAPSTTVLKMKYGIVFPPSAEKQSFVSRLIKKRYILNAKVSPSVRDLSITPKHFGFTSIFEVSL